MQCWVCLCIHVSKNPNHKHQQNLPNTKIKHNPINGIWESQGPFIRAFSHARLAAQHFNFQWKSMGPSTRHVACVCNAAWTWEPARMYPFFLMHTSLLATMVHFILSGHWEKYCGWLKGRFTWERKPVAGAWWLVKCERVYKKSDAFLCMRPMYAQRHSCESGLSLKILNSLCYSVQYEVSP